jgi:hypothetical protein
MSLPVRQRLAEATRPALQFGSYFAVIAVVSTALGGAATAWDFLVDAAVSFALGAGLVFLAVAAGGRAGPGAKGAVGVRVSPWFAWLVAGGLVVFWAGTFWFGDPRAGGRAATAWAALVLAVWALWSTLGPQKKNTLPYRNGNR